MRITSGYFKHTKKYQVGAGGPLCPCCTKLPPNEAKIKVRRMLRRRQKIEDARAKLLLTE